MAVKNQANILDDVKVIAQAMVGAEDRDRNQGDTQASLASPKILRPPQNMLTLSEIDWISLILVAVKAYLPYEFKLQKYFASITHEILYHLHSVFSEKNGKQ